MWKWFRQLKESFISIDLSGRFLCLIGEHDWTNSNEEGIPPTKLQLNSGLSGFMDYAKMYCKRKHCRKLSKYNQ